MINLLEFPGTTFLYLYVVISTIFLAYLSTKHEKFSKVIIVLIITRLSLFCGFRGVTVGTDTLGYFEVAEALRDSFLSQVFSISDPGYLMYIRITMVLFGAPQASFIITAFIINSLFILRLRSFRKKISFTLMVTVYVTIIYWLSFSGIRQMLAVSILFMATRYLERSKYFIFILFLGLAFLFHKTSLIGLLFIPIYYLNKNRNQPISIKLFTGLLLVALTLLIFPLIDIIIKLIPSLSYYTQYLNETSSREMIDIGFMIISRIWLAILMMVVLRKSEKKNDFPNLITIVYTLYALSQVVGAFFYSTGRIGWYFIGFEPVFFGIEIGQNKFLKLTNRVIKITIIVYSLYTVISYNGNGLLPYIPFWMAR